MHSAQSSEALAANILSTLSEFESDPNSEPTGESVHNLGWNPSAPTLVHAQDPHARTRSHTLTHAHTRSHTLTHAHTRSHTLTHAHTRSHTLTHAHTRSHTLTHASLPEREPKNLRRNVCYRFLTFSRIIGKPILLSEPVTMVRTIFFKSLARNYHDS